VLSHSLSTGVDNKVRLNVVLSLSAEGLDVSLITFHLKRYVVDREK
jgi:hypothetical protein